MPTILRAPARLTTAQRRATTTLFLAGPFDDGDGQPDAEHTWRDDVIEAFADLDVTIIDPRSDRWGISRSAPPGGAARTTGSAPRPSTPTW